jgi:hypothetical protein
VQAPILPVQLQVAALVNLLAFLAWVVSLIRSQRLSLRESLLWLVSTLVATAFTAYPPMLTAVAHAFGVQLPANAVFGAGLVYVAVNVLSVTLVASANASRVRRLAQECALLRAELAALRAEVARGASRAEPEAGVDRRATGT